LLGERILDRSELSIYKFRELRERLALPRVGERVRSKRYGTVWKVIEEKETWLSSSEAGGSHGGHDSRLVPAIHIRFWREDTSKGPGTGKTMTYRYSIADPSFQEHWEILYDW
jgi:hypothetical protein